MKFGMFPLSEALGGILAHSMRLPDDAVLKKGLRLDAELIDLMLAASMEEVLVAIPEAGDMLEDEAATRVAELVLGSGLRAEPASTGRVNIYAVSNGVFRVNATLVNRLNAVDPGITLATLADFSEVNEGRMVATVKIIPYGLASHSVEQLGELEFTDGLFLVPFTNKRVGLISTLLPGTKPSVLKKTRKNLERRLELSNSTVVFEDQIAHTFDALSHAIKQRAGQYDILIAFGASAISDRRDIIPSAIEAAGGTVKQFGMPVDPGNLLLLAEMDGKPVIGAPGCARSIAINGFDWMLQRLLADIAVSPSDIAGLGVGGLLMETGARPHPREKRSGEVQIAALVLAAGQSRRMGETNKLTAEVNGKPMVRHVVEAALASSFKEVRVVTGHESTLVRDVLVNLDCQHVENPDFAEGLSTSLAAGVASLDGKITHVAIILGDMPFIASTDLGQLIETCQENPDQIIMATSFGKRGNPVLWPSRYFSELKNLQGDIGARHIIAANSEAVVEVEIGNAASQDIDTPAALHAVAAPPDSR